MEQREFPYIGSMPKPQPVAQEWLDRCETFGDALRICFELRTIRYTQGEFAALLPWDSAQLSRFLNRKQGRGKANPDPDLWERWMSLCGNALPAQYLARQLSKYVLETPEQKITRLERENAQLKEAING